MNSIPRNEYPNPQFKRNDYEILNGTWEFEIDNSLSAIERGILNKEKFDGTIIVPFCPESSLSGVGNKDYMHSVWYKREINIPEEKLSGRVVLHFGAVDYTASVYVNGKIVTVHNGGFVSFEADITDFVTAGSNTVIVNAFDPLKTEALPGGKQSKEFNSHGCFYTRTTGIWQTVWLEYTPKAYIKNVKYYTDIEEGTVTVSAEVCGKEKLFARITYEGEEMASSEITAYGTVAQTFRLKEKHLWEAGHGRLYNIEFTFGEDKVSSYFGLRSTRMDGMKYLLNEKSFFQRTVLDQGYYPDGIMTAPSEQALIDDIEMSLAAGFNGARLHQKVFEPLFLYHCDRLGYVVWGEYPSWGLSYSTRDHYMKVLPEWLEVLERDFNHPSIIGWCPLNEVWGNPDREIIRQIYRATKKLDPTRPCIDTSGGYHTEDTDIFCIHDYDQNPESFASKVGKDAFKKGERPENQFTKNDPYMGQAIYVSEYGGIAWKEGNAEGWGYGKAPKTKEEYLERYEALTKAILDNPDIMGFCYTQLYDLEQEINGIYTYARKPKFSPEQMARIKAANTAPAAIEQ